MKTIKYLSLASVALAMAACADLDEDLQGNVLTIDQLKETLNENPARAEAELTGLYKLVQGPGTVYGTNALEGGSYPDDGGYPLFCFKADLNAADIVLPAVSYNWFDAACSLVDRDPTMRETYIRWMLFYQQIKGANDLINKIDVNTNDATLLATLGQAYAVRAFDYMCLAPYYQLPYAVAADKPCVPIITETTTGTEFARNTVKEVYSQILADLDRAEKLLEGYERTSKTFIDQSVVYALRARAQLNMSQWSEAAKNAQKALEAANPSLCDGKPYSLAEVSRPTFCDINDHNWLWGQRYPDELANGEPTTWASWLSSFGAASYATVGGVFAQINQLLFDKIDTTDVRRGWWVDENIHSKNLETVVWKNGGTTLTGNDIATSEVPMIKAVYLPYTNVKFGFQQGSDLSKYGGDWCIIRVEELLLIQAECAAQMGNTAEAQNILNKFITENRNPAYKQKYSNLIDEIWFQRRVELWGEGFAFADMMRLQKPLVRFHSGKPTNFDIAYSFNYPAHDPFLLMRFPSTEINANPAIVQNTSGNAPVQQQNGSLRDGVTD